jgi:hypothetical protein
MYSRFSFTLALCLACAGLTVGQESTPAPGNFQGRVGKTITVQEANRAAERCTVVEAWELADGNIAMQVRSIQSNLFITVVEQTNSTAEDRFLVYRWSEDGLPPGGCPVPPGMKSMSIRRNFPSGASKVVELAPQAPIPPASRQPLATQGPVAPVNSGVVQAGVTSPAPTGPAPATPATYEASPAVNAPVRPVEPVPIVRPPSTPTNTSPSASFVSPNKSEPVGPTIAPSPKPAPAASAPVLATQQQPNILVPATPPAIKPITPANAPVMAPPKPSGMSATQAKATTPSPTTPVLYDAPRTTQPLPPLSGVVQASGPMSTPITTTRAIESRPVTKEMPRTVVQGQPTEVKPLPPVGPAQKQPPAVVASDGTVGRLITVTEKGKHPEQCVVLEACCQPDGGCWMQVKSLATGEVMTIVCGPDKGHVGKSFLDCFRRAKRNDCEVCCEPSPTIMEKVPAMPKHTARQEMGGSKKLTGDPLLPPGSESVVKKVDKLPDSKPMDQSTVTEKPKKQEPRIAEKSKKDEPKLPPVNPKDVSNRPVPPAENKIVDAKPLARPEPGVNVPVPLVPLSTADARPGVPPPQPVLRPYDTHESKAVINKAAEPQAPIPVPGTKQTPPVVQAVNKAATGYQPRMPNCDPCTGPVATTGWTGPFKPITDVPPAIEGVKRASYQQDPVSTENTVHLIQVLQSSGTPAQREWAASRLCTCDPRVAPYVIETLATVAKADSAALVRAACIKSLVKLQANNATVMDMLQQARSDRDPRVRDEADVALAVLVEAKPAVQQAGQKSKK